VAQRRSSRRQKSPRRPPRRGASAAALVTRLATSLPGRVDLAESTEVLRVAPGVLIVRHHRASSSQIRRSINPTYRTVANRPPLSVGSRSFPPAHCARDWATLWRELTVVISAVLNEPGAGVWGSVSGVQAQPLVDLRGTLDRTGRRCTCSRHHFQSTTATATLVAAKRPGQPNRHRAACAQI
jgi:hypothetical protein